MSLLLRDVVGLKTTKTRFSRPTKVFAQAFSHDIKHANANDDDTIIIKDVRLKLGSKGSKRPILNGVNLTVKRGTLHMLLGPNGCGKSTLLKILGGLLEQDEGTVTVSKPTGFVFQNPDHQVVMPTVAADVAFGLGRYDLSEEEVQRTVVEALTLVNLQDFRYRATHTLSGGQRQRVAIAGALAEGPRVLLLDELTTFLDVEDQFGVLKAVRRITNGCDGLNDPVAHHSESSNPKGIYAGQSVPILTEDDSFSEECGVSPKSLDKVSNSSHSVNIADNDISKGNQGNLNNKNKAKSNGTVVENSIKSGESKGIAKKSSKNAMKDGEKKLGFRKGVTALWVTHRFEELEYADAVSYMENGRVIFTGTPEEARNYMRTLESPI
mmetsp:Transcript_33604/g.60682  ORF Transcript_33604/g.60682 Transcript_33604/m.60682 type:complete len:381 (-) Transcript_33604:124-1266(-)